MQDSTTSTAATAGDHMDRDGFEQRVIPASQAAPIPSPGVRSAFELALGSDANPSTTAEPVKANPTPFKKWLEKKGKASAEGRAQPDAHPKQPSLPRGSLQQACLELMKSGPVSMVEVSEALNVTHDQARSLLSNLCYQKKAVRRPKEKGDTLSYVELPGGAPQPAAATAAPSKATPRKPTPASRVATPATVAPKAAAPAAEPAVRCALFNTGHLHIEVAGQAPLLLDQGQSRALVAYLDQISAALQANA